MSSSAAPAANVVQNTVGSGASQQWQFAVPTETPTNVGEPYADVIRARLRALAVEQPSVAATTGKPGGKGR